MHGTPKRRKKRIKNILFVCTGNSCRSIMAEGLLRKMLKDKGRDDIKVSSAGIAAIGGFKPTDNTIKVMKEEGIDVSSYKTEKLTPETIKWADLILAMEDIHVNKVLTYVPEAKDKTHLLKKYIDKRNTASGYGVPDPIGRPLEVYERIFNIIKTSIEELVKRL